MKPHAPVPAGILLCLAALAPLCGQNPADDAYAALRAGRLDEAVGHFRSAVARGGAAASTHKDYAYALLRTGEREAALEQFEAALHKDPADERTALEFAFLAYELKRQREARLLFRRLSASANAEIAAAARQAFDNVDRPLADGISRWQAALAQEPAQWSGHEELARLAFQRDALKLAETHYREALRLKPDKRDLLLELGLTLRAAGQEREALACLLALSRGSNSRLAEQADRLRPNRYPYVYEFEDALRVDPANEPLRRELYELKIAMGLEKAPALSARELGMRSLERSYLPDALRYLRIAQEENPEDAEVALKLGQTYNLLGRDKEALEWFGRARQMGHAEANGPYRNLRASLAKFHWQAWALPVFSSRWQDLFAYGQVKGEWRTGRLRPYLSVRINGDVRGSQPGLFGPVYLSENAAVVAGGIGLPAKHGLYVWAEAGQSFSLRQGSRPDYRGGVYFLRQWKWGGRRFHEAAADGVFLSRFDNNLLVYSQNRTGWRLTPGETSAAEFYWNSNLTVDAKRQAWANFVEFGPGVRVRWSALPPGMSLRFDFLRGVYTRNSGNPQGPNYWDARASLWYAFTR